MVCYGWPQIILCRHRADLPVTADWGAANCPRCQAGARRARLAQACPSRLFAGPAKFGLTRVRFFSAWHLRSPGPREDGYESRSVDRVPPARTQHELSHRQRTHPYSALPRANVPASEKRAAVAPRLSHSHSFSPMHCLAVSAGLRPEPQLFGRAFLLVL